MRVSYDKEFRLQALSEQKGLGTIEIIAPGKKPGARGIRITYQMAITEDEFKKIHEFALSLRPKNK